jgi:DNA replication protein DnaC
MRTPEPPPLPEDLETLLRRLRLPHIRRAAPEVLATARSQRWEPAEVLRSLLGEELAGRERSALQTRRKAASWASPAWPDTALRCFLVVPGLLELLG